jgi:hypothetical protein
MPAGKPKAFEDLKQVQAFGKIQLASVHKVSGLERLVSRLRSLVSGFD